MASIIRQRMTAHVEGDFVVFLIGMRINKPWKLHKWLPVAMAMPRMLKELSINKESGLLGFQVYGGVPPVIAQYWRSFEHLERYAKDRDGQHYPAWKAFNKNIRSNGDVGIWHETFQVKSGAYECIYNNMPRYGLGKAGNLEPVQAYRESASERIQKRATT